MDDNEKLLFCIASLRKIAKSYRERIDRRDTLPYEFAQQILDYIGEDLELSMPDGDKLPAMFLEFHNWRLSLEGEI